MSVPVLEHAPTPTGVGLSLSLRIPLARTPSRDLVTAPLSSTLHLPLPTRLPLITTHLHLSHQPLLPFHHPRPSVANLVISQSPQRAPHLSPEPTASHQSEPSTAHLSRSSAVSMDVAVLLFTWIKTFQQWRQLRKFHSGGSVSSLLLRDGERKLARDVEV